MKKNIINKTLSIIMNILSITLIINIFKLDIIPEKYLIILITFLIIINLIITTLAFKIKNIILKLFTTILIITLSITNIFGIYYINTTNQVFTNIKEVEEQSIYYVVVKKESKYKKIKDLTNKTIAIYDNKSKNYQKALEELTKQVKVNQTNYTDTSKIVKDLLNDKIDSILINSNNKELLDENMKLFKDNTKVLEELSITLIKEKEQEYKEKYGPFNILISGIDTNGSINKVSRSDVNIIMTINQNNHEVLLTNIPRDTEVKLHDTTGLTDKLTHAGIYGIDMSRKTLEDFLDIEIPYYVRVNFDSLVQVVDAIGGVDIYNDVAFKGYTRYFPKGNIHLTGKQALEYSRERKKMPSGDWTRGIHQQEVIKAIITKVTTSKELLTNYKEITKTLENLFQTNIPEETIKKYVKDQLDTMPNWQINQTAVKIYDGVHQETYSAPGVKLYVSLPDQNSIKEISNIINRMLENKKYNEIKKNN